MVAMLKGNALKKVDEKQVKSHQARGFVLFAEAASSVQAKWKRNPHLHPSVQALINPAVAPAAAKRSSK